MAAAERVILLALLAMQAAGKRLFRLWAIEAALALPSSMAALAATAAVLPLLLAQLQLPVLLELLLEIAVSLRRCRPLQGKLCVPQTAQPSLLLSQLLQAPAQVQQRAGKRTRPRTLDPLQQLEWQGERPRSSCRRRSSSASLPPSQLAGAALAVAAVQAQVLACSTALGQCSRRSRCSLSHLLHLW